MILIKREDAKNIMLEIIKRLSEVEVRGDSVEHLFMARIMIKQLLDASEEQQEKQEGG